MSQVTSTATPSELADSPNPTWRDRLKDSLLGTTIIGFIIRMTLAPLLLYVVIFILGFWRAWVDPTGSANYFEYVRGLFEIVVSIASILIIIAIGVLVVQIARFINLLRSEIKPIADDTKQAVSSMRVTAEFIQKNAIKPVIQTQSLVAGILAFLAEIIRISRLLQRRDAQPESDETE